MDFVKVFSMSINKLCHIFFILLLFVILPGCDMSDEIAEPAFKVYGDATILENMVINIENSINDAKYPGYSDTKVQTLLYKGKQQAFRNSDVISYSIYFSYENKVNKLTFDNIMSDRQGHINYLYVFKKDDGVYLKYYGVESNVQKEIGPISGITIPLDEYFRENNILDEQEQQFYQLRFFNFFDPNLQEYQLEPLNKINIEQFKKLPLEEKINYDLPADYLRQMNLPEDELNVLLKANQ